MRLFSNGVRRILIKVIKMTGLFGILTPVFVCAAGGLAVAQESSELLKEESSRSETESHRHPKER
jgi:hypothetical protein